MIQIVLVGCFISILNLLLQSLGYVYWLRGVKKQFSTHTKSLSIVFCLRLLVSSFVFITLLHLAQTFIWAVHYYFIPSIATFENFSSSLYFSLVTFTTLGYGDITIKSDWRLLSGIEAINGIMLIGWSTSLMFLLLQQMFQRIKETD